MKVVLRGEVLVDASGPSNTTSNAFPWVESSVLTRTSVLLSPESLIPFRNLVRSRFPEVSKFLVLEPPAGNELRGLKESSLTDLELLDVKLLTSFRPVDCNVLIEKEGDAGALQPYIVEMSSQKEGFVPQMDAKAMKAFSRTNKRKQGSQASEPVHITKTQHEDQEAEVIKAREAVSELESLQEKFRNLSLENEKMEGDLADLKNEKVKYDTLLSEKSKLLEATEEKLLAEQNGRKEDANHLKAEKTFQYEQGFEKAIDQVKFLHPEINIDEVGAFKEIQDGKLVDIPDDEE
ncbi:hypothetical protein SESBI_29931 [Sesbania bispinosa]|nr:hypothetical protein SESBI_29931 [Sesbania bispinosa]